MIEQSFDGNVNLELVIQILGEEMLDKNGG